MTPPIRSVEYQIDRDSFSTIIDGMAMLNRVSAGFARHCEAQYCQEVEMGKLKDQRIAQLTEQLNARNNLNVKMCEELADEIVQLTNKNCKLRKKRAAFPTKKGK